MENQFKVFAEYFPYKKQIYLCEGDRDKLVTALLEVIKEEIEKKESNHKISRKAAHHLSYLKRDYGIEHAARYYHEITRTPKINLTSDFFNSYDIKHVIDEINKNFTNKG